MRISLFADYYDNAPETQDHTWATFCSSVIGTAHRLAVKSKDLCPLFSPAEFEPGATRRKEYVLRIHLAVLDYDELGPGDLDKLRARAARYRSVLYSSYSHTDADPRVRLVFDLSRPVASTEWLDFWLRLTSLIPVPVDAKCKDASRMYVLPYTPAPESALLEVNHDAEALPVDRVLAIPAPVAARARAEAANDDFEVTQPVSIQDVKELAARYKKLTRGPKAEEARLRARWFEQLAGGQPFALEGSRHATYLRLTAYLEREFPRSPLEAVVDLFEPSLRAMAGPDFDATKERLEIFRAAKGAREQRLSDEAAYAEARERGREAEIREAFAGARTTEYTTDEIDAFAKAAGTDRAGFRRRWIVTLGKSTYLFVGGAYRPPVASDNLAIAARRDLAPATGEAGGVSLTKISAATGQLVRKTRDEILDDYGTAARAGVASFALGRSYYDPVSQTIHEAVTPLRQLEPAYSEAVDEWLKRLAGDLYSAVCLWLQESLDLTKPLAALYLEAGPGVGKSMFAAALARNWGTHGPISAAAATGDFNDAVIGNPVVFADEALPAAWVGAAGLGRFREFVATDTRSLNRKHMARVQLHGCLRVVLAANNLDLIGARLQLTPQDREAILARILHVGTNDAQAETTRRYLAKVGDAYGRFVHGDEFAKHVRWLAVERPAGARQGRFGVAPVRTKLHDEMKAAHEINSAVGQWLIGFLLDKQRGGDRPGAFVRVQNGRLLANVQGLAHQHDWERYVSNPRDVPPTGKISKALIEFSEPARVKSSKVNYYVILPEVLHGFADQLGVTPEAIDAALTAAPKPTIAAS